MTPKERLENIILLVLCDACVYVYVRVPMEAGGQMPGIFLHRQVLSLNLNSVILPEGWPSSLPTFQSLPPWSWTHRPLLPYPTFYMSAEGLDSGPKNFTN